MKTLIVANWKMNPKTLSEALKLAGGYRPSRKGTLVVCPPAVFLQPLAAKFGAKMAFGAQDCMWEQAGAFTGGIAPKQLAAVGGSYVILGHSERRQYFAENDKIVNRKVRAALSAGIVPILCLGGGLKVGLSPSKLKIFIRRQFYFGIDGLKSFNNIAVVFEPAYAISTFGGQPVPVEQVASIVRFLRQLIIRRFGGRTASATPILYGGSVDEQIVRSYLEAGKVNGFLIGGASLRPRHFNRILKVI